MSIFENWSVFLAFVSGALLTLLFVGVLGITPAVIGVPLARGFRTLARPAVRLLRLIRVLPKPRGAQGLAAGAKASLQRGRRLTDLEAALLVPDDLGANQAAATVYDFAVEKRLLEKHGRFFKSLKAVEGYVPESLTAQMTDQLADHYLGQADRFFNSAVPLRVNEKTLYEDAEGAVIVWLFRGSDRRCFYALNEMRKTINDNARNLVLLFSGILLTTLLVLGLSFHWVPGTYGAISAAVGGIALVAAQWGIMKLIHAGGYEKQQQNAVRELERFLLHYVDRIGDRYRDASTRAMGVATGEEKDTKNVAEAARKWHKIMLWMPFRTFFIECFVRNVRFQIDRNCSYYEMIPIGVILFILPVLGFTAYRSGLIGVGADVDLERKAGLLSIAGSWQFMAGVLAVCALFAVLAYIKLIYKVVIADELNKAKWRSFSELELGKKIDELIGKYGSELGFLRNRRIT